MKYAELGEFLVRQPLYRSEVIEDRDLVAAGNRLMLETPESVTRDCESCQLPLTWDRTDGQYIGVGIAEIWFKCRNCKRPFVVLVRIARRRETGRDIAEIEKVGQYPKLEVTIPKEFGAVLGDRLGLYRKGMTSRHSNYGVGALAYFRRLVEETTDEMLNLLGDAMKEIVSDPGLLEKLAKVQAGPRFEDKVKLAAEVMPATLLPGGVNPFGDLYELLSVGLHQLSDEECCDIVDDMDRALKFIYTHLKAHTADAKAYIEAAKDLHKKLQRLKKASMK